MTAPKKKITKTVGTRAQSTSRLFGGRKPVPGTQLSHEEVSAHVAAFRAAGGKIEVLGHTRTLLRPLDGGKNIAASAAASSKTAASAKSVR